MVKVVKTDKSIQGFKSGKIEKACIGAGVPKSIAKAIASDVSRSIKNRKIVKSSDIKKMIFAMFDKIAKAKAHWINYKKK
ncbi:Uncharacterised protein [Candidatus Tiddalikarchaeum anstoanum]|nr:Uncharacterised protein [Candidatus Tiddalikarchaeum anstoanum]